MAAVVGSDVDLDAALTHMERHLATYARPLFIRLVAELEQTGTFKAKKMALAEESYDVTRVHDPVFYLDTKRRQYKPLNLDTFQSIRKGILSF